ARVRSVRRRQGPDHDARGGLLPVPGARSDSVTLGAAGRRSSPSGRSRSRELARADVALHRGGDGLADARLTLRAESPRRHPLHPGGASLSEHRRADPRGMAEGPERRTGGRSAGVDARALRETVDLDLVGPGDRHLPDHSGHAIPDARRRLAHGLSHAWRIPHAARLLREPRAGVAQVAEKVGYTSEAAFAKAFKRTLGRTPGKVRRSTE